MSSTTHKDPESGLARQRRMFSFLLSKEIPPVPKPEERKVYPENHCDPISYIMFWWINPLLRVGYKRTLQAEDMFTLEKDRQIGYMYEKFERNLRKQRERQDNPSEITQGTLNWALFRTFWFDAVYSTLLLLIAQMLIVIVPLFQRYLINFVEARALGENVRMGKGVGYVVACTLFMFVFSATFNHFFYRAMLMGSRVKAVLTKALLEKSYRVDAEGRHKVPSAKVTTMITADLNRVEGALTYLGFGLVCPFPTIYAIVMLIVNIGVASLVGIAIFLFSAVLMAVSLKPMKSIREKTTVYTDERVGLVKELLKNFKIIKLYSWENAYGHKITEARTKETSLIMRLQNLRSVVYSYANCLPTMSAAISFCVMFALQRHHSVGAIFSSLMLFEAVSNQFSMIPFCVSSLADYQMAIKRSAGFLSCGDEEWESRAPEALEDPELAVKVVDGEFKWEEFAEEESEEKEESEKNGESEKCAESEEKEDSGKETEKVSSKESSKESSDNIDESSTTATPPQLTDVNISIPKGAFVAVTGQIGSGKSSLLAALSGFMKKDAGHVYVNGSLLLCGLPWVQNTTVRENIVFGHTFDRQRYSEVVDACCLNQDFEMLPGGDNTEVGERGVTLSGGQKARVNLARAVYADQDIVLMDDVLSAVDAKVGKSIMEKCILGLMRSKTRILATHQLSLISSADLIVFLNGDGTLDVGTQEHLLRTNAKFENLMKYSSEMEMKAADKEEDEEVETVEDEKETKITAEEEKAVNHVKKEVYTNYLREGAGIFHKLYLPVLFISVIITAFCLIFTNNWLTYWVERRWPHRHNAFYMGIYLMFSFSAIFWMVLYSWILAYLTTRASRKLNLKAAQNILHTTMSYIDTTPTGRILNRFTKDTDVLDNEMVQQWRMLLDPLMFLGGTIVLIVVYMPWFAITLPFTAFIYFAVSSFYIAGSREIKRIQAVQRSTVFSHISEAIDGIATIKAHHQSQRFLDEVDSLIDSMNESTYLVNGTQRWLAMNLGIIGTAYTFLVSLLCCFRVFHISASATGLLLNYVFTIASMMATLMRAATQVENEMNSVERVNHYAFHLEQEAPYEIPEHDPHPDWPENGQITFSSVSLRYRPELPYVLKKISLSLRSRERVGFCGRTGAGKSTIMSCLFRLVEYEGTITVDGVDISTLGLHTLRSRLSIIPQDPVLFEGTVRSNLDPFSEKSDTELWEALRKAGLIDQSDLASVQSEAADFSKFHLLHHVDNDGTNYSLGERQLIALARALVRETRILILDEATSSVDYETDSKVQRTIATEFADCAILCIAHRLKTILTYDRIVVLDEGEIVQFDTPRRLFDQEGIFRTMCDQSGIVERDFEEV